MRPVRSFVRREGRVTSAQKQALDEYWPRYGFDPEQGEGPLLNIPGLFGRDAPTVLEIGYGDGEALLEAAERQPERNFIGAEVYRAGVGHCLLGIEKRGLGNIRLCQLDALELLQGYIPDGSLQEIRLFFPDPWPKKKHHKRRIVNQVFAVLIARKLCVGGCIHFATDWAPYADWALEVFEANTQLENIAGKGQFLPRPESRIETKFERRGARLGQPSQDLIYRRLV